MIPESYRRGGGGARRRPAVRHRQENVSGRYPGEWIRIDVMQRDTDQARVTLQGLPPGERILFLDLEGLRKLTRQAEEAERLLQGLQERLGG